MAKFKKQQGIFDLINQLSTNPDQLEKYIKCELGEIPLMDLVDLFDIAFPGIKDVQDYENLDPAQFLGNVVSFGYF